MVMRDGKPCGLNKMSGVMPDSVKGMSSAGHSRESTPRGHVSDPSRTRPGHVLRGPQPQEQHALLAVARRKLVARDGVAVVAEPDEGDGRVAAALLPVSVAADDAHLLHHGCASRLSARRLVVPQLVL